MLSCEFVLVSLTKTMKKKYLLPIKEKVFFTLSFFCRPCSLYQIYLNLKRNCITINDYAWPQTEGKIQSFNSKLNLRVVAKYDFFFYL